MLKSLLKDSLTYTLPSIISRGLSFILIPLYTRVLSSEDYGVLDLALTFGSLCNIIISLEISQALARFYSDVSLKEKKQTYIITTFKFVFIAYFIFTLLCLIYSKTLTTALLGSIKHQTAFQLAMLYFFINGIFSVIQNQFRWDLQSKIYTKISIVVLIATTSFTFLLTYILKMGIEGTIIAMIAGSLIGIFFGFAHSSWPIKKKLCKSTLLEMLSYSLPLVPSSLFVFANTYLDRIMIKYFLSLSDVGVFGIGVRFAGMINLVIIGFRISLTPQIYSNYQKTETPSQLALVFKTFVILTLTMLCAIGLFSKEILALLTPSSYHGAASVITYLTAATIFSNMYIFAPGMDIMKKTKTILAINLLSALVNIFLNFLLIPRLGIEGAALSTLISGSTMFALYMVASQNLYFIPYDWKRTSICLFFCFSIIFFSNSIEFSFLIKTLLLIFFLTTSYSVCFYKKRN